MTTEEFYTVETRGLLPNVDLNDAVRKMSERISGSSDQLKRIAEASAYKIKSRLDLAQATHYVDFLTGCGLIADMTSEKTFLEINLPPIPPPLNSVTLPPRLLSSEDLLLKRRLTEYEKISGALWVALGIFQCITVVGIIAGLWNIFAGWSRFKMAKRIFALDRTVPSDYEPISDLIIIGVINLFLGGVIGLIFVGFDFFIRDKILSNSFLFTEDFQGESLEYRSTDASRAR